MSQTSSLPTYSAIYAFGDSLSDAGNLSITTSRRVPPNRYRRLTTRNNTARSAATCSATGRPGCRTCPSPSASARSRPAWPAARISPMAAPKPGRRRRTRTDPTIQAISLPAQLARVPDGRCQNHRPNALYTLSIGSNDMLDILDQSQPDARSSRPPT